MMTLLSASRCRRRRVPSPSPDGRAPACTAPRPQPISPRSLSLWRSRLVRLALALILALLAAPAFADTAQKAAPQSPAQVRLSFAPVVKKVAPAVVNVYASRIDTAPRNPLFDDPIFQRFFGGGGGEGKRVQKALGSGVLVDRSGLVVTNYHVIENMTDVRVALADKREFDAEIALRDPRTDLAVLRIKGGDNFPVLEMGDSDALEVGDFVIAIGDPFGVGQTVTQGIVSALARTQIGASDYGFFIQTDAAINPGNSGGALVDLDGQARRHQFDDLFAIRRQHGARLRHSGQHGQGRGRSGAARRRDCQAAVAGRDAAEPVEGHRREPRARTPDGGAGRRRRPTGAGGGSGPQAGRCDRRNRRPNGRRRRERRLPARSQAARRFGQTRGPERRPDARPAR